MTPLHTIRLRGHWSVTSSGARTTHSRKFGRPRTLDPNERVWLVCAAVPGPGDVLLNEQLVQVLSQAGPIAVDITEGLRDRNEVIFSIESDQPVGELMMEIRRALN